MLFSGIFVAIDRCMTREFNNIILKQAEKLKYTVSDIAPNSEIELFNNSGLVVWSGQSNNTIWNDAKVNHAFRALHDALHIQTRLDFSVNAEIELGRIQANQYQGLLADLIYCEVSEQALHYGLTGNFVADQVTFTLNKLKGRL
jgi:hypothetical protein